MGKVRDKSLHHLASTIYIRSLLEAGLGLELSSISEIRDFGKPSANVIVSLIFALLTLLVCLCFTVIMLYYF
jgi:hypothetical protein